MSSKKTPHLSSKTSTGILEVVLEDAPAKSLQTELQTRQLEKILLTRTTASREGEMSRGHHRMREFQGDAISASKHRGGDQVSATIPFRFRLYVAGDALNSAQALGNLTRLCQAYLPGHHEIETVDVLTEPMRALADGVLMTPTLVKLAPGPVRRIVGTLSQLEIVLDALGLKATAA